jgi:hypothetical protein
MRVVHSYFYGELSPSISIACANHRLHAQNQETSRPAFRGFSRSNRPVAQWIPTPLPANRSIPDFILFERSAGRWSSSPSGQEHGAKRDANSPEFAKFCYGLDTSTASLSALLNTCGASFSQNEIRCLLLYPCKASYFPPFVALQGVRFHASTDNWPLTTGGAPDP